MSTVHLRGTADRYWLGRSACRHRQGSMRRTSRWPSTGLETTMTRESSLVTLRRQHRVGRRRHAHRGSRSSSDLLPEGHTIALVDPRHEGGRTRAPKPHIFQITQSAAKYLKADRQLGDGWNSGARSSAQPSLLMRFLWKITIGRTAPLLARSAPHRRSQECDIKCETPPAVAVWFRLRILRAHRT